MKSINHLTTKIFADCVNLMDLQHLNNQSYIQGFTTNPTLMKAANIKNYEKFAMDVLSIIRDKPISFAVVSDDITTMYQQAIKISSWGKNVYVKIPIMNTRGKSTLGMIKALSEKGINLNVTTLMTITQIQQTIEALKSCPNAFLSIFAGRIADTGKNPSEVIRKAVEISESHANLQLIWASARQLLNIFEAEENGCHIITLTQNILKKLSLIGKDLETLTLETVAMFYEDALISGLEIKTQNIDLNIPQIELYNKAVG